MKIVRLDTHRPSAINPAEYEFVAFEYEPGGEFGPEWNPHEHRAFMDHQEQTGGKFSEHEHGGSCHICGAHALYMVIFYHRPSNTYIKTGNDCAAKMELDYDEAAFQRFHKNVLEAKKFQAGRTKARDTLAEKGLEAAWGLWERGVNGLDKYEETTIRDIVGKLIRYGSVSDKQLDFVGRLLTKIADRANIEARRAANHEAAAPVPEGRVQVTGVILSEKTVETNYGPTRKMLVKADAGYKVWGSFPRYLAADKGDRITFLATLEKSKDDEKFGFFSRPTKAEVVEKKETA